MSIIPSTTGMKSLVATETTDAPSAMPRPFLVVEVEKIDAPEGGEGRDWYCYVLESGRSRITGQRRGSHKDVLAYATQYAEQLNARSGFTGQSIWNPRGKKPPPSTSA